MTWVRAPGMLFALRGFYLLSMAFVFALVVALASLALTSTALLDCCSLLRLWCSVILVPSPDADSRACAHLPFM